MDQFSLTYSNTLQIKSPANSVGIGIKSLITGETKPNVDLLLSMAQEQSSHTLSQQNLGISNIFIKMFLPCEVTIQKYFKSRVWGQKKVKSNQKSSSQLMRLSLLTEPFPGPRACPYKSVPTSWYLQIPANHLAKQKQGVAQIYFAYVMLALRICK